MAAKRRLSAKRHKRLYYLVHRIYRLLSAGEWRIVFERIHDNRKVCLEQDVHLTSIGFCDYGNEILCVDYRYDILGTIVHECLHAIFQDKKERDIKKLEKFVMNNITPLQAKRIMLLAAKVTD